MTGHLTSNRTVRAPGRVNLIGDHTDYTGGFCFPIAIAQGVTVTGRRTGDRIRLRSESEPAPEPRRRAASGQPRPTHYKVICISMYTRDIEELSRA